MGFLDSLRKRNQENFEEDQAEEQFEEDESLTESSDEAEEEVIEDVEQDNGPEKKQPVNKNTIKTKNDMPVEVDPSIHKVLTIINQKGGVGKSTTAINLAGALGEFGAKVLVIDLDPQGNTTSGFGIEKKKIDKCVYNVLLNDENVEDVYIKDAYENVDVLPATINLAGAEVELVTEIARENRLKDAINKVRDKYNYIFIDCPPSLGLLTVNALVAADSLLIPIQTEFYALEGVTKLLDSMKRVKSRLNPDLDIFGVLLTMYDGRTTLAKQVAYEVNNYFKDKVFDVMIPRTVKISEAPSFGQPITQYDPTGRGSISYKKLAKEVINRG